ncbi:MAG: hypothetical protein GQ574_21465 [Crocinitomix sp.]|nr:hypothetical protein [Crocinitomix sp.]
MQITQSIANALIRSMCLVVFCCSGFVYGQEEELLEFPVESAPKKGETIITRVDGAYALKRDDSTFVVGDYNRIEKLSNRAFLVKTEGKCGLINEDGLLIIPLKYSSIAYINKKHSNDLLIKKGNKYGLMNDSGDLLLPTKYCEIYYGNSFSKLYLVRDKKGRLQLLMGAKPELLTGIDKLTFFKDGALIEKAGKFGFIHQGTLTIQPEYDGIEVEMSTKSATHLANDSYYKSLTQNAIHAVVVEKDGKKELYKVNGGNVFDTDLDEIKFDNLRKVYTVKRGDKWGAYIPIYDTKIDLIYDRVYLFGMDRLSPIKDGKQGVIDYSGKTIIPCAYSSVQEQLTGDFIVKNGGKSGLISKSGEAIFPVEYDKIEKIFSNRKLYNHYHVARNGLVGIIMPGEIIVPIAFKTILEKADYFIVEKAGLFGIYNFEGLEILAPIYDKVFESRTNKSNIIITRKGKELALVNQSKNPILLDHLKTIRYINNSYNLNNSASENKTTAFLGVQSENGKWGVFEELKPKLVVPIIYDEIIQRLDLEKSTYFIVMQDNKMGVINSKNEILIPIEYQSLDFDNVSAQTITEPFEVNIVAKKNGKYGLIDLENNTMIPFKYHHLAKISFDDIYKAKTKTTYRVINSNNEKIFETEFDNIGIFEKETALTFKAGKMRVINQSGTYITDAKPMTYHQGYRTFEALKIDLINALNSKSNAQLSDFAHKITPSKHMLYLYSKSSHTKAYLEYSSPKKIGKRYYEVLLEIKGAWNSGSFDHKKLTKVEDYTYFSGKFYSNSLKIYEDYGSRELGWILSDAVRLDGFWVSTFFLKHRF